MRPHILSHHDSIPIIGTALSGHYFIYQRDNKEPSKWFKYNDSFVTDVPGGVDEVFLTSSSISPSALSFDQADHGLHCIAL